MHHKRNDSGFSLHFILIILVVVVAIGFSGWYVINRQSAQGSSSSDLTPGYITVIFKDGVTHQQVLDLAKSYSLHDVEPLGGDEEFIPHSYRGIKPEKFTEIQNNLKKYPEVVSFIDDSSDPSNNRAEPGEIWVQVTYTQSTTCSRIKRITTDSGLGTPNQICPTNERVVTIKVPDGQEDSYIRKFKSSSLVRGAERISNQLEL